MMKIRVQIVLEPDDGSEAETIIEEIGCCTRSDHGQDVLGLTLAESKIMLTELQRHMVK